VVAGLLVTGHRLDLLKQQPATHPSPKPSAPTVISADTLQVGDLENVADLVVPLDLSAETGDVKIRLVGAYADTARTALVFRGLPWGTDSPPSLSVAVYDDQGVLTAASTGRKAPSGDYVWLVNAGLHSTADGQAHIRLEVFLNFRDLGSTRPRYIGSLVARIPVQSAKPITTPAQVMVGGVTFELGTVEVTPNAIHVVLTEHSVSVSQLVQPGSKLSLLRLTGPDGAAARELAVYVSVNTSKDMLPPPANNVDVIGTWLRGGPGKYRLTITYGGDQTTLDLIIP
jgi:hypothetical protein